MRKVIFLLLCLVLASCATPKKFGYPKGTQMNTDWRIRKL